MVRASRYRDSGSRRSVYRDAQVGACDIGTCRDNPIPPGIYWIDAIGEDASQALVEWLRAWSFAVEVIRTEDDPGGWLESIGGVPASSWALIEVKIPTLRWNEQQGLSLPTVAPKGRDTIKADTVQKPPPEKGILDDIGFGDDGISPWVWVAGGVIATLGVIVAVKT